MPQDAHLRILSSLSALLGWLYFAFWSVSFYPQLLSNHARRSVTGLSVDFVVASFYGFLCYSIFNCSMYFSETVREEYRQRHDGQDNLVALNDVIFAVHAAVVTFIFMLQVYAYRKPNEGPSLLGMLLAIVITVTIIVGAVLSYCEMISRLQYLYSLSYLKLILTIIKCIPQVWLNWLRKSTAGWSILNVLLDFFGGFFSVAQLLLDAFISGHNLQGIIGFLPKLILGVISISFDTIFILQHYLWFPDTAGPHISTQERYLPPGTIAMSSRKKSLE